MKRINNYRFQQQQQKRQEYKQIKQIKKKLNDVPVDATEELEYMKNLLSGKSVEDFKTKKEIQEELDRQKLREQWVHEVEAMSYSDYLRTVNGIGYFK